MEGGGWRVEGGGERKDIERDESTNLKKFIGFVLF